MSPDHFEALCILHDSPYQRIGDDFYFPVWDKRHRWIYFLDVNTTGLMVGEKRVVGSHPAAYVKYLHV